MIGIGIPINHNNMPLMGLSWVLQLMQCLLKALVPAFCRGLIGTHSI
jgi:hypothetical protein